MKLESSQSHLTYCMNVHPGETWEDNFSAIKTYALQVRDGVSRGAPFGLGLRLSYNAARELYCEEKMREFKEFLGLNNLYVFTINGFPYGDFHGKPVKQDVYKPDWRTEERLEYTTILIDILSELLPEGMTGSISTLPCSYNGWVKTESERVSMLKGLVSCAEHCAIRKEKTGREIHLGLEMEPDCFLETTGEAIEYIQEKVLGIGSEMMAQKTGWSLSRVDDVMQRHIGVCFDTCHLAIQFERLEASIKRLNESGVRISKVQISSALKASVTKASLEQLARYNDPVYLHQVKARKVDGMMVSWPDLPEFLSDGLQVAGEGAECRVHCHVPLYFTGSAGVGSTSAELTRSLFQRMNRYGVEHFEIETYTFGVLPTELQSRGVVLSVIDEYRWIMERMRQ